jgi:hypothetical protein
MLPAVGDDPLSKGGADAGEQLKARRRGGVDIDSVSNGLGGCRPRPGGAEMPDRYGHDEHHQPRGEHREDADVIG